MNFPQDSTLQFMLCVKAKFAPFFLWFTERLQDLLEEADELHERTDYRQPLGGNSGKPTKTGWKMDPD